MADDEDLDAGQRAHCDRVQVVLNGDQDRLVPAVPHDVREKVARVGRGDLGVRLVDDDGTADLLNDFCNFHLQVSRLKFTSRGESRVAFAAKIALSPATENSPSASVHARATSSRLCASDARVTA